jgi:DNA-binding NarL/FixJ family response regulator
MVTDVTVRVMVVDDHPMWRDGVARDLAEAGYEVGAAVSEGAQAVRVAAAIRPDVVVLDLLMPEMDGIEFLKQISSEGYKPSIVISSGADEDTQREMETVARTHGLRVLGFIPKPVSVDALLTVLARHGSQDSASDDSATAQPEVDPANRIP